MACAIHKPDYKMANRISKIVYISERSIIIIDTSKNYPVFTGCEPEKG